MLANVKLFEQETGPSTCVVTRKLTYWFKKGAAIPNVKLYGSIKSTRGSVTINFIAAENLETKRSPFSFFFL